MRILQQFTMFCFLKITQLNFQPAQYLKKLTKIFLKQKNFKKKEEERRRNQFWVKKKHVKKKQKKKKPATVNIFQSYLICLVIENT